MIAIIVSRHVCLKKRRAERQLFAEAQKGKRQPAKEKASRLKKGTYSRLQELLLQKERMKSV
jgi:hypothetical protein